jgi:hypothetical protein
MKHPFSNCFVQFNISYNFLAVQPDDVKCTVILLAIRALLAPCSSTC